jgi:chemotaxis protein MotB
MSATTNQPIIIKRKKVIAGGGHHGGAWKVAYADFVTAMMAFFMLMWLLNATTESQRKGIADYFSPTIPLHRVSGGGSGMFGGESVFTTQTLPQDGRGGSVLQQGTASTDPLTEEEQAEQSAEIAKVAALQDIEDTLLGRGGESLVSEQAMRHVVTRLTDEGLVIELYDVPGATLFVGHTDTPSAVTTELADMIARVLLSVENPIAISAHLATQPIVVRDNPIWDLSAGRANQMRILMEGEGFDPLRVSRMTGGADRSPVVTDVTAPRNNRVEIIVLRSDV